jgi:Zn-dependent M28 family amino/carboxypeptidase
MRSGLLLCVLALVACGAKDKPVAPEHPKLWEDFSGENALRHVQHLVDLGPRPPGSEALEQARLYITQQLEGFGWQVERQSFTAETPRGSVTFVNLLATFPKNAKAAPIFLLCSHYDTKVFDDFRFVGANDGGSSNGVLLELARVLATQPQLAAKVQLVFFDGEEAYVDYTETDGFFGSRYFARQLVAEGKAKQFRGGILFDMVGDRDLRITLSPDSPPTLTADIFAAADALQLRRHFTYANSPIMDDHTALNAIGIPVIDLIDFDYPPWHTAGDTMDKLSAESHHIVGAVAARYLVEVGLR